MAKGFLKKLLNRAEEKPTVVKKEEGQFESEIIVGSPIKGRVIALSEVKDEVFSQGMLGKGIAIVPKEGKIYAPVTGKVKTLFPTKHAVGFVSNNNVELLIHIGMDTVQLNGKYFKAHVKEGSLVNAGDIIMEFDIDKIQAAGYEVVTPVVVTNTHDFSNITAEDVENVDVGDRLLTIVK